MLDLTTPALLFPAISLLLLAYTNRFLTLAGLVRALHREHEIENSSLLLGQIRNLQKRIALIKTMQMFGVFAFLLCVVSMGMIFFQLTVAGDIVFAFSLLALMISLVLSLAELSISVKALNLQLSDLEGDCSRPDAG
jgi:predicted lysophospholipase L1 biosynthesis ABC-type transport system permease subunit